MVSVVPPDHCFSKFPNKNHESSCHAKYKCFNLFLGWVPALVLKSGTSTWTPFNTFFNNMDDSYSLIVMELYYIMEYILLWKKLVSNDSEMSNSARNGNKNGGYRRRFFKNLNEICPKSKLLPFLTIGLRWKLSSGITE